MLQKLNTPGGHLALVFLAFLVGVLMVVFQVEHGTYVLLTAAGVFFGAVRSGDRDPVAPSTQIPKSQTLPRKPAAALKPSVSR
jgi:hypothetical protein